METIFAPATAPGRSGIAVLRISGPAAGPALLALSGRAELPPPRRATLARLRDPATGIAIDRGLVLWLPGPDSFTGEDSAELHVHGARTVIAAVVVALAARPGLRLAEPGEFTRRAFEHGKMDLTAAEAVADLIDAETEAQRRQALAQLDGALGRLYDDWRVALIGGLAHVEAEIDFPDEDLPAEIGDAVRPKLAVVRAAIAGHLDDDRRGERLREGLSVVILGPPNVGKSSLLNALSRRDAAIVSALAGTTRDVIEVHLDLAGYPLTVADTAGLRAAADRTGDPIEAEGIRRALARARQADLKIVMIDAPGWPGAAGAVADLVDHDTIVVINKIDLAAPAPPLAVAGRPALALSVATGEGMAALSAALQDAVADRLAPSGAPTLTRARHRAALARCAAALDRALAAGAAELVAEDLRLAVRELGRITGRVDVEDILDIVFRDFCIGK